MEREIVIRLGSYAGVFALMALLATACGAPPGPVGRRFSSAGRYGCPEPARVRTGGGPIAGQGCAMGRGKVPQAFSGFQGRLHRTRNDCGECKGDCRRVGFLSEERAVTAAE